MHFEPRKEVMCQGDQVNLVVSIWISILKMIIMRRSVYLEASKIDLPINRQKSIKLRKFLLDSFENFMKVAQFDLIDDEQIPHWVHLALAKLQKKVRHMIMLKAKEMFEG
jgi:hypothetical protein